MGQKREEVEEAGRDYPIVRLALDCHRDGLMDYETAMEEAVLAQAKVIRELEKKYSELIRAQPMHIVMPGPPCNTE